MRIKTVVLPLVKARLPAPITANSRAAAAAKWHTRVAVRDIDLVVFKPFEAIPLISRQVHRAGYMAGRNKRLSK